MEEVAGERWLISCGGDRHCFQQISHAPYGCWLMCVGVRAARCWIPIADCGCWLLDRKKQACHRKKQHYYCFYFLAPWPNEGQTKTRNCAPATWRLAAAAKSRTVQQLCMARGWSGLVWSAPLCHEKIESTSAASNSSDHHGTRLRFEIDIDIDIVTSVAIFCSRLCLVFIVAVSRLPYVEGTCGISPHTLA